MQPATMEFAVYVPGTGFMQVPTLEAANAEAIDALWKLYAGTRGPLWPPDIHKLGVYARQAVEPLQMAWQALGVVKEEPGTRLERWPCPSASCELRKQLCDICEGSGSVDQYGEPWTGDPEISHTVRYEFEPVSTYVYGPRHSMLVSRDFGIGARNALLITGAAVLVILAIWAEVFWKPH